MDAALLNRRVAFDRAVEVADGYGGVEAGWEQMISCRASYRYLRTGEAVQSMRLAGRQAIAVTVRRNATSLTITPAWRMRDLVTGFVFNVQGVETSEEDRRYLEVLVTGGEVAS